MALVNPKSERKEEHADQNEFRENNSNQFVGTNLMDQFGPPVTMYACVYDGVLIIVNYLFTHSLNAYRYTCLIFLGKCILCEYAYTDASLLIFSTDQ